MKPEDTSMNSEATKPSEGLAEELAEEPSVVVRNLGLIKAASVIMGILIIILTAVLVATIFSRLSQSSAPPAELSIQLPEGAVLRAASADDDGYVVVVDTTEGQQIWRLSPEGTRLQTIGVTTP